MRDHCTCQTALEDALAHGRDGWAEFLQTRCDLSHQDAEQDHGGTAPHSTPARPSDSSGATR